MVEPEQRLWVAVVMAVIADQRRDWRRPPRGWEGSLAEWQVEVERAIRRYWASRDGRMVLMLSGMHGAGPEQMVRAVQRPAVKTAA